jgi:hypothetical protein
MALGSQQAHVEAMADLTGLTHDIFVGRVLPNVRNESPVSMIFQNAGPGEYELVGQNMKFAADYRFATGGLATDGKLPDHQGLDPVQGTLLPVRRYRRIAMDNFVEARATGKGAFANFSDRIFDILWDSWKHMEIRHSIGASGGLIGKVESRTSSTVFIIKDAYGNVGTNPLSQLTEGSVIAWWDLTATAAIDGAGIIESINYETREITLVDNGTWEPANQLAADDLIYFSTTDDITRDYFVSERNLAPNGLGTIVDPTAALTTVFGIAEADFPRSKPFRKASITFDHLELQEHWLQLASKRGFAVTPQTDICVAFPSAVAQVARGLMALQQQAYTGGDINGGYGMVRVGNMDFVQDHNFYHDVCMTLCKEKLFRINLGDDADYWAEDGSMWARLADFDGKEAFVVDYLQLFSSHRGANSALTGITTELTDEDFTNVPSY